LIFSAASSAVTASSQVPAITAGAAAPTKASTTRSPIGICSELSIAAGARSSAPANSLASSPNVEHTSLPSTASAAV
jgi:hypothetical protein